MAIEGGRGARASRTWLRTGPPYISNNLFSLIHVSSRLFFRARVDSSTAGRRRSSYRLTAILDEERQRPSAARRRTAGRVSRARRRDLFLFLFLTSCGRGAVLSPPFANIVGGVSCQGAARSSARAILSRHEPETTMSHIRCKIVFLLFFSLIRFAELCVLINAHLTFKTLSRPSSMFLYLCVCNSVL